MTVVLPAPINSWWQRERGAAWTVGASAGDASSPAPGKCPRKVRSRRTCSSLSMSSEQYSSMRMRGSRRISTPEVELGGCGSNAFIEDTAGGGWLAEDAVGGAWLTEDTVGGAWLAGDTVGGGGLAGWAGGRGRAWQCRSWHSAAARLFAASAS